MLQNCTIRQFLLVFRKSSVGLEEELFTSSCDTDTPLSQTTTICLHFLHWHYHFCRALNNSVLRKEIIFMETILNSLKCSQCSIKMNFEFLSGSLNYSVRPEMAQTPPTPPNISHGTSGTHLPSFIFESFISCQYLTSYQ